MLHHLFFELLHDTHCSILLRYSDLCDENFECSEIMNYEWLDPYLGYVGSLTRMLDATIKSTKNYCTVGS